MTGLAERVRDGALPGNAMPLKVMGPALAPGAEPVVPLLLTWSTLLTITRPVPSRVTVRHCSDVAAAGPLSTCLFVWFTAFDFLANAALGTNGGGPTAPAGLTVSGGSVAGASRGSPEDAAAEPKTTFCTEMPAACDPSGWIDRELWTTCTLPSTDTLDHCMPMSPKPPSANWLCETSPLLVAELVWDRVVPGLVGTGSFGVTGVPCVTTAGSDDSTPPLEVCEGANAGGDAVKETSATVISPWLVFSG